MQSEDTKAYKELTQGPTRASRPTRPTWKSRVSMCQGRANQPKADRQSKSKAYNSNSSELIDYQNNRRLNDFQSIKTIVEAPTI